jgi:hypothetical protein
MTAVIANGLPRNPRDAAVYYHAARRWVPVPLVHRGKRPVLPEWSRLTHGTADVSALFPENQERNLGISLGEPSGGLVDVDLDAPEAVAAAHLLLPRTPARFGRPGKPLSHWLYTVVNPPRVEKFTDPTRPADDKATLVELRGTGGQTVFPPSVYETGESIEWAEFGEPVRVELADLRDAVTAVAAAALIGRHWRDGSRNDAALALSGGLLRAGWSLERAEGFIRAICAATRDAEVESRVATISHTADRLTDDKQAVGWPTLAEILGTVGDVVVKTVRAWLRIDAPALRATPTASETTPERAWPDRPNEAAFRGIAGDVVRAIEPTSESDPAALLIQGLVYFGNVIGRSAHFVVESDKHYANEFAVLMGQSSKARKGTSRSNIHRLFAQAEGKVDPDAVRAADDPTWANDRTPSGLSSGEGVVWAVRDPIEKQERVKERGQEARYETVVADPGEPDKRLLVFEPEFANVLKQTERQGNTLSTILRQSWETGNLRTLTKNNPARATGAHISIIGHITTEELTRYLSATESANGFGNRFMWFLVKRSKLLPEGGRMDGRAMAELEGRLAAAIGFATKDEEVWRDGEARELWHSVYGELSEGRPGLAGCLLGRAEAHVMRLAMIYALMDLKAVIGADHLLAALALWDYAERSVLYVFGDNLGDPLADDLLKLIRASGGRGITKNDIVNYLGRHTPAGKLNPALMLLRQHRLAHPKTEQTGGRPAERWFPGPGE